MAPIPGRNRTAQADTLSPLDIRLALFANGYFPVLARGKAAGGKGWTTPVTGLDQITALTEDHPRHVNTGLLCGDLVGIDIDALDPETADALVAIAEGLPGASAALRRVGKAPKVTFLFRAEVARAKAATKPYMVNGLKCQVEVMGDGQQIIAFGEHPDTGRPYEWIGASPLVVPFSELPVITAEAIDAFVAEAEAYLSERGTLIGTAGPARVQPEYEPTAQRAPAGDGIWAELKSRAMANLGAWVPALGLSGTRPYEGGFLARADFRPSTSSRGLSGHKRGLSLCFSPDGIVDYAAGNQGYNPVDITATVLGIAPAEAADWLRSRIGDERPAFDNSASRTLLASVKSGRKPALVAANDNTPIIEDEDDDDEDVGIASIPEADAGGLPEALCFPPGAVGEFARFILSCARFPSPHLSLVASLAFTAGLIGRRYKGPTGLRSNLYVVGLAESGFGKDVTIRVPAALADSTLHGAKVSEALFTDQIRSLPGLAGRLRKAPSCIAVVDEFGRFLADHTGRNVATHRAEVTTSLMELTGATAGFWGGQEKAGGNIPRIVQPCFSIHGISTPSTFWGALSSGNISEGLLGRLVLVDVGNCEPKKVRRPVGSIDDIPSDLSRKVAALLGGESRFPGPFCALSAKSDEKPFPVVTVEWDPGVDDLFEEFDDRMRAMKKSIDPQYRPILNRVGENAARLAMIVAVGCAPKAPVITREIQEWANAVAEHSLRVILNGADMNIADNDKALEYLRVRQIIIRKRGSGITKKSLVKAMRGAIDTRRMDDITKMLRVSREVHWARALADSGQTKLRYWAAGSLPEDAIILPPE
ncbi:DNA primase [Aurantimonas sp. A2-1-M11]|uniref:bifunctional DNA primase/polymerase n=1 Tax=Aurantimonas sp. A2-1-M11 TaxID=3113712 RepID=UPI002F9320F7